MKRCIGQVRVAGVGLLVLGTLLGGLQVSRGTTVTSNPLNGTTGVSPSAAVVFTFSAAMDTTSTAVSFYSTTPPGAYPVNSVWSSGNTVLTCTPLPAFPANVTITWLVSGQDSVASPVYGTGTFTTGTGSGSGSLGTNATTTFAVGKINAYDQTNSAAPTLNTFSPFVFNTVTALMSNRTASTIAVTTPSATTNSLTGNTMNDWSFLFYTTVSNTFESIYPQGTYTFYVNAATSNQTVSVFFPPSMTQPNPPHVTNYTAAQSVNPSQAFTLYWDPFVGAAATDYVYVAVGDVWKTSEPGTLGALPGTATSATIPAGTLQGNSNYTASIYFYHAIVTSNTTYATEAYRATATMFNLSTVGSGPSPVLTNAVWTAGNFSFDIATSMGQTLTVVYSTNCTSPMNQWKTLLTTNSPGSRVHVVGPASTSTGLFFRARNGS